MSLRADEISTLIQKQIQGFEETVELKETGRVISVGDGIARIYGFDNLPTTLPKAVVHRRNAPVIVEEHYYGPGYYHPAFRPPPRFYRRFHRHRRPGVRWGVAFGN